MYKTSPIALFLKIGVSYSKSNKYDKQIIYHIIYIMVIKINDFTRINKSKSFHH